MLWSTRLQLGDGETSVRELVRTLKDGMLERRFSVLEEGRFVAAPEGAEVGDAVFVLIGCSVPVCLRRDTTPEKWRLVGECYVQV